MKLFKMLLIGSLVFSGSLFAETMKARTYYDTIANGVTYYSAGKYEKAFNVFSEMAKWGDKHSQYFLGNMYLGGQHVKQNIVEGAAWLVVAGEAKREWKKRADEVLSILTADELKLVNSLSDKYIEEFGMEAQNISCRMEIQTGTRFKRFACIKQIDKSGKYMITK